MDCTSAAASSPFESPFAVDGSTLGCCNFLPRRPSYDRLRTLRRSAQGVMPLGKRLARAGLVWMAFFKSA